MVPAGVALLGRLEDKLYCALGVMSTRVIFSSRQLMIYWNNLLISVTF